MADGGTPSGAGALRRALAYLRSYKRESGGAIVSLLLVSAANLLTPLLIGRAIDDGVGPRRLDIIFVVVGVLVGLALVRGLFTFLQGYLAERASQGVAYDLRDALFERIERLSFSSTTGYRRASSSPGSPATWSRSAFSRAPAWCSSPTPS